TQFSDEHAVQEAREALRSAGLLGTRAFVGEGEADRLSLGANLVDALVVCGETRVSAAEAMRVLRPGGRAWLADGAPRVKPFPVGTDDWSHPYHGPDNNPLSHDQLIRAPYLTQFLADPRYAPLPQVAVAAHGRVFKAFGHIAFKKREEPLLNTLAAFNGYNGALLWKRAIPPALMVHRNTLIATADRLYFGDDRSCKVYAAATGELLDEVRLPEDLVDGTFWKWMALDHGVLYALVGEQEQRDPTITLGWDKHGWPWNPLSPGFNQPEHTWGYGRTLVAIATTTKRVLWSHREEHPIDSRSLCMSDGRLYGFRFGEYLFSLDLETGRELWRRTPDNDSGLFAAFGKYLDRQDWRTNWRTTAYARCTDRAIYFAGPSIGRLIAVDATNGDLLWDHPSSNYQLIVRPDAVYGLSGQIDSDVSRIFDPLTGEVLAELKLGRRACTRPTGCEDAIFFRASGGSVRLDTGSNRAGLVSPMRAQCQDGVTIANGLLYWWPSVCDCNLSLYGITALGPAGDFDFNPPFTETGRLTRAADAAVKTPLAADSGDWPVYRGNSRASSSTEVMVPAKAAWRWRLQLGEGIRPTAPTTAGGLAFVGGSDGSVQALDVRSGKLAWRVLTGGAVNYPPTLAGGRAYVGSGDGSVYCLEAKTGRELWRFRVAPAERVIPVYGSLRSTWPVGSGVLVEDGVAYAAAGIVNYDGTHVVALDAETGALKWHNGMSGHLDPEARSGVSVQGHLLMVGDRLHLAGGNAVSPAVYDAASGRCLN
ncbi:MAG: PQQ-binding-like beta-propeller repeat protein, partial [Verrucomicrobiae bacterium]|nr:PQQ-binding-like beta-propeller repeat protein [Verrucomicrobiae bacterium]